MQAPSEELEEMMEDQNDFDKEWKKAKAHLAQLKHGLTRIAQKGEKELKRISRQSLLHVDSATLNLKKEHLFYLIGKEYAGLKNPPVPTTKLKQLFKELKQTNKEHKVLSRKI